MDDSERNRILISAHEGSPGTEEFADWLEQKANVCKPSVVLHGRCSGLNQIFRERPITDAVDSTDRSTSSS